MLKPMSPPVHPQSDCDVSAHTLGKDLVCLGLGDSFDHAQLLLWGERNSLDRVQTCLGELLAVLC